MSLTTSISLSVSNVLQKTLDLSSPSDVLSLTQDLSWADGTSDDQADKQWHDQRTLAAGANDDIDLAGSLTDALGDSLTFARIKAIIVVNLSTQYELNVKPGASNGFSTWISGTTPLVKIPAGGIFFLAAPKATAYAVTAGTADILRITNAGAGSADYKIILVGASV